MNETEIAEQFKLIISEQISKSLESLNLQLATQNELISNLRSELDHDIKQLDSLKSTLSGAIEVSNKAIDKIIKDIADVSGKSKDEDIALQKSITGLRELTLEHVIKLQKSSEYSLTLSKNVSKSMTEFEIKLIESQTTYNESLDEKFDALNAINKEDITKLSTDLNEKVSEKAEQTSLRLSNIQGQELLRLNDHVNKKLNALKGEKGDAGEKGNKGKDGFLSRVSQWEAGNIIKQCEAVIHNNALWTCSVEQSAKEPSICDDWSLVVDGIKTIEMAGNNIQIKYSSGRTQDIGRVGFVHKGQYDSKQTYMKGDIVTVNKTSFVSMEDGNTNNPPSNNWKLLSGKGDKGAKGDRGGNIDPKELTTLIIDVVEGMK